ncbi:diguanylate phosphodiesterase [Shewanella colwelliana]|uniref:EAL domain-containing protein n=1 Tax=Shewanella colwelliana TaxID=23 RepID=A0A1E5IZ68_SHECO|nr:EAL domain-containing protein [Shewanella colwelliana]OEG75839.1 hypothetical protein BEL05_16595 [Shewanella colwelliana]GIU23627.1 diguanylate phosphodiesterase [Shewanella colwelliana]
MTDLAMLTMGCEYQPLVNAQTGTIYGYEALARFVTPNNNPIAPNQVFDRLHHHPALLTQVELAAKQLQIAHSNPNLALFVNLDPHAVDLENLPLFIREFVTHRHLTVEIIENTCVNDAQKSEKLVTQLHLSQINTALDDIGAPHAMLSLALMSQVSCLKFDMSWLNQLACSQQRYLIQSLVQYGKFAGKLTILEGIETAKQLNTAQELGIDLVQGFLFKTDFVTAKPRIALKQLIKAHDNTETIIG